MAGDTFGDLTGGDALSGGPVNMFAGDFIQHRPPHVPFPFASGGGTGAGVQWMTLALAIAAGSGVLYLVNR